MKKEYIVIKGNCIAGQTYSLKKAKKMADDFEGKSRTNCFVVKLMKR